MFITLHLDSAIAGAGRWQQNHCIHGTMRRRTQSQREVQGECVEQDLAREQFLDALAGTKSGGKYIMKARIVTL